MSKPVTPTPTGVIGGILTAIFLIAVLTMIWDFTWLKLKLAATLLILMFIVFGFEKSQGNE